MQLIWRYLTEKLSIYVDMKRANFQMNKNITKANVHTCVYR